MVYENRKGAIVVSYPEIKMFCYGNDEVKEVILSKVTGKDVSVMKELIRKRLRRFGIGTTDADFDFDIKVRLTEIKGEENGRRLKAFTS